MTNLNGDLRTPEQIAKRENAAMVLRGRTVLTTGASRGTGRFVLENLPGAQVVAGMTYAFDKEGNVDPAETEKKVNKVVQGIGAERTSAFLADITDADQVNGAFSEMIENGRFPTDVILSAAGGMDEGVLRKVIGGFKHIQWVQKYPEAEKEKRQEAANVSAERQGIEAAEIDFDLETVLTDLKYALVEETSALIDESLPMAEAINCDANIALLEKMKRSVLEGEIDSSEGIRIIFYSSLPSTFFGEDLDDEGNDKTLFFYRGVAQTKNKFEKWMEKNWEEYANLGIYFGILTAHMIKGTDVARAFRISLRPVVAEEKWAAIEDGSVTQELVYDGTEKMLTEDISRWKTGVRRLYLLGEEILEDLDVGDPRYQSATLALA